MLALVRSARAHALLASSAIALVGALAGAVRLLPWLLEPHVPWRVAAPFARGLLSVALEAALTVGWPVGWALACFRVVENGEALVLQTLGEPPAATTARLAPQGAALALVLSTASLVCGSDASAPGRVATELVEGARASCAQARTPATYVVPFTDLTWLCAPGHEPRLVGKLRGGLQGTAGRDVVMTARAARIAGDFREIDLDDARVAVPGDPPFAVHVSTLSMHGMAPWAHASTLPASLRALLLALSAWSGASVAAYGVLRGVARARIGAMVLGAAGPLAGLGLLRVLERANAPSAAFASVPLAASMAAALAAVVLSRWRMGFRLQLARRK
jgi:hypothetical protein